MIGGLLKTLMGKNPGEFLKNIIAEHIDDIVGGIVEKAKEINLKEGETRAGLLITVGPSAEAIADKTITTESVWVALIALDEKNNPVRKIFTAELKNFVKNFDFSKVNSLMIDKE